MALLASIFAYLSTVAVIIVFFLMSADALLYHPHHHVTNPRAELTTAVNIDRRKPNEAAQPPRRPADVAAIPQKGAAVEYRRKTELSNARFAQPHRRALRRDQPARDWALRRERVGAPFALGYAEEAPPRSSDEPWR